MMIIVSGYIIQDPLALPAHVIQRTETQTDTFGNVSIVRIAIARVQESAMQIAPASEFTQLFADMHDEEGA
jgi:hypothetical protein